MLECRSNARRMLELYGREGTHCPSNPNDHAGRPVQQRFLTLGTVRKAEKEGIYIWLQEEEESNKTGF